MAVHHQHLVCVCNSNGLQEGMKQHYALGQYFRRRYIEGQPHRLVSAAYDRHQVSCLLYLWVASTPLYHKQCKSTNQTANQPVQPILHSSRQNVVGHVLSPNNCPLTWKIWASSNACFPRPIRVYNPNGILIASAVSAQFTEKCRRTCWGMPFPSICPSHGGSVPRSNTWFFASTWLSIPIGVLISSAGFA